MPFIWYPSDYAGKSIGISTEVERLRRGKVPQPGPEFAGRLRRGPKRHLSHALVEFPVILASVQCIGAAC